MKKIALAALIATTLAMPSHAQMGPAAGGGDYGTICTHSGSNVLLRAGAGQKFAIRAKMPSGSDVVVLSSTVGGDGLTWHKVRYGKKIGFVRYDYVC